MLEFYVTKYQTLSTMSYVTRYITRYVTGHEKLDQPKNTYNSAKKMRLSTIICPVTGEFSWWAKTLETRSILDHPETNAKRMRSSVLSVLSPVNSPGGQNRWEDNLIRDRDDSRLYKYEDESGTAFRLGTKI